MVNELSEIPKAPFPIGYPGNAQNTGWRAYFNGKRITEHTFPPARVDLVKYFREGWKAAQKKDQKDVNAQPD